jgi:carboxyvinyl-carboxyphosphonate phosphorylmutase
MTRWSDRRARFRAILGGKRCVHPASVFDPISARIAEDLGFEAGMFAGSVASLTVLGAPDLIVLTLSEFAGQAYRICRAGELPLLVDADHGYGNALNVMRTVEELEAAGIAGLSIEDTLLPQPFGASGAAQLTTIEEGVGKVRAALAARRDPALVIAGRTSAAMLTGVEDAIARAKAYEQAGADAIFLVGVRSRADMDAISAELKLPLIVGGVGADLMDLDYLGARSVRICLQGHQPFAAAVRAVHDTMKALRDGTPPARLEGLASKDLMKQVSRGGDYARWTEAFLSGKRT